MQLALISKLIAFTYKLALHKMITGHLVFFIASQFKMISNHGYQLLTNIQFVM